MTSLHDILNSQGFYIYMVFYNALTYFRQLQRIDTPPYRFLNQIFIQFFNRIFDSKCNISR